MAFEISGINRIMKRLSKLETINTQKAVEETAKEMEGRIRNAAKAFSNTGYKYISACEPRVYGRSVFVDVGLKNDNAPWDLWKGLYFHNFGYRQHFYGHDMGYMETRHLLWFENAVNESAKAMEKELKQKVKEEIKKALG